MKPVIPKSPPSCGIREKLLWNHKFQLSLSQWPCFLLEESLPHAITMVRSGTSDLNAHISKLRGRQIGRVLKLPCVTNVELTVMSGLGVLHLKRNQPGIMDLLPEIIFQGISSSKSLHSSKEDLGPQETLYGETEDCRKGNLL